MRAHRSSAQWDIVFDLVAATATRDEAARLSFDLLTQISNGSLDISLNVANFAGFIRALEAFVAAAGTRDIKVLDGRVPCVTRPCPASASRSCRAQR
jgi:hypothetical protein